MGITIESKNHAIDLGYVGFRTLRVKIAELAAPDIFEHYKKSMDGMQMYDEDERKSFYESYNAKTAELDRKYNGRMSDILDFLYESDCSAEMDVSHCRSIYKVIKNYDDNILYGYAGRKDCAKFADFKKIVKDGIDSGEIQLVLKIAKRKQKK
jgi:hypothetical protein